MNPRTVLTLIFACLCVAGFSAPETMAATQEDADNAWMGANNASTECCEADCDSQDDKDELLDDMDNYDQQNKDHLTPGEQGLCNTKIGEATIELGYGNIDRVSGDTSASSADGWYDDGVDEYWDEDWDMAVTYFNLASICYTSAKANFIDSSIHYIDGQIKVFDASMEVAYALGDPRCRAGCGELDEQCDCTVTR